MPLSSPAPPPGLPLAFTSAFIAALTTASDVTVAPDNRVQPREPLLLHDALAASPRAPTGPGSPLCDATATDSMRPPMTTTRILTGPTYPLLSAS